MGKIYICLAGYLLAGCFVNSVKAQNSKSLHTIPIPLNDSSNTGKNLTDQLDLSDVVRHLMHKKAKVAKSDSVTGKPVIAFIPAVGYTLTAGLGFTFSGNAEFRTSPGAHISTLTSSVSFTAKEQFTIPIESYIYSRDGNYIYVGDYRFYKYPQSTYGLGSSSNIKNEDPMVYNYVRVYETVLRKITGKFFLGAGYIVDYHYSIVSKGNIDGTKSDYSFYRPKRRNTVSSGYTINGLYDARDNTINPTTGGYAAFQYRDSYRDLGSTSSWRSLIVDLRKYYTFPADSHNVLALWSYNWLVLSGRPPYLDLPATTWDAYTNTGRGYIQGRFRGAQMVYGESEYRFGLTRNGLLGGVLFVNGESLSAAPGTRLQAIQPGFGPGLRIKLNKITKTNVCVDYGFGRQGSRGLFVNVGELF